MVEILAWELCAKEGGAETILLAVLKGVVGATLVTHKMDFISEIMNMNESQLRDRARQIQYSGEYD